jgi:hypothetical protein
MTNGLDAEQVPHLAFKSAGREGQVRQRRHLRLVALDLNVQLDALVRRPVGEEVDNPEWAPTVMRGDQGQTVSGCQQCAGTFNEFAG